MHKRYVIEGDLTDARIFDDARRTWDAITDFRLKIGIDLRNQHASPSMFKGPIHVICNFYLLYPKDVSHDKRVNNSHHTRRPTMSCLIYFLERIATGIIFGNCVIISSLTCNKIFTLDNPRVELEIYSLKGEK